MLHVHREATDRTSLESVAKEFVDNQESRHQSCDRSADCTFTLVHRCRQGFELHVHPKCTREQKRKKILRSLTIMNIAQLITGLLLVALGVLSRSQHGPYLDGVPPYFTGAFIGTAAACLQGSLGCLVSFKGKNCQDKNSAARKVGCLMQFYAWSTIMCGIAYVAGLLLVGFTGICQSGECSYLQVATVNRRFAITITVFTIAGMIFSAIGLAIVYLFSSSFGLKMFFRGQYQISVMDNMETVVTEPCDPDTAAIEAVASVQPVGLQPDPLDHSFNNDNRFPEPDFSRQHLQHFLTQQYKDKIRKRRRKNKKRKNKEAQGESKRRRQNGREADYVLPPLTVHGSNQRVHMQFTERRQIMPSPSPPPPPTVFHPPSPSPPPTPTPPPTPYLPATDSPPVYSPPMMPTSYTPPKSPSSGTEDSAVLPVPRPPTPPRTRSVRHGFQTSDTSFSTPRTTRSVFITQMYTPEYSPTQSDYECPSPLESVPPPNFPAETTPPPQDFPSEATPSTDSLMYNGSRVIHVIPCGETLEDEPAYPRRCFE